jgi:energy-converting hydrogenase Eha subunit F
MKLSCILMLVFCLALGVTACGKKPSTLLIPDKAENPAQIYPQSYPKAQTPPPPAPAY